MNVIPRYIPRVTVCLRAALVSVMLGACTAPEPLDLVLRGGRVVDGTGAPSRVADVGIRAGRLVAVGDVDVARAGRVIDVDGLVVAPGFIDLHAHTERGLVELPGADNLVLQGVTTVVSAPHSGRTPWPLDQWLARLHVTPNTIWFVGHNTLRDWVVGEERPATEHETATMVALVQQAMRDGAWGLSSGLVYRPGSAAEPTELEALARAVGPDGRYATHMRDSGPGLVAATEEAIQVARATGTPTLINHLKATTPAGHAALDEAIALLDQAREEQVPVTIDAYPYAASGSSSSVFEPLNPGLEQRLPGWCGGDLDGLRFRSVPGADALEGRTLREVLILAGLPETWSSAAAVVRELHHRAPFRTIASSMRQEDVDRILERPGTLVESDGNLEPPAGSHPHPRSFGTFPRFLQRYVRERGTLTLEEAVHRMTGGSADWLGLQGRGRIVMGGAADLVVFDPDKIGSRATIAAPRHTPDGLVLVLVNGVIVAQDGVSTGARPGVPLRP